MTKKAFLWFSFFTAGIILLASFYYFFIIPEKNLRPIYLVPDDAVYILESEEPIENWEKISNSEVWRHLQKNEYFANLTENANSLDSLFQNNKTLFKLLGSRSLIISAHMYKKDDHDFLFIVDLQKVAKLSQLKDYLGSIFSEGYQVSQRKYHDTQIIELYDKESRETLSMAFIENLLVASYTHLLVEAAINQVAEPIIGRDINFIEVTKKVRHNDMFRMYLQYQFFDDYLLSYTGKDNDYIKNISHSLMYSGMSFDLEENNRIVASGYTNINNDSARYLTVMQESGQGDITIPKVAPQRTAFYLGMGFDSFDEFYGHFEEIQQKDATTFRSYRESYQKIEKFLKIDIEENFIDWIDDEIAFLQMQSTGLGEKNEFAVILKSKDPEEAKENLDFIIKQIKKKTPVKFKQVTYKGFSINFLSIKGFFKLILGKLFADLNKPYFTIIEDYVIFSNHPQTLKNFISDYISESTLANSNDFKSFMNEFDGSGNLFLYVNTPVLHKTLKSFVSGPTKTDLDKNKDFITCFPQIGFQLIASDGLFENKLVIEYQNPGSLKDKVQFTDELLSFFPQTMAFTEKEKLDIAVPDVVLLNMVEEEEIIKVDEISPDDLDAKFHKEYYENDVLKIEVPLKDGLKHGTYREYYPNGNIKLKGKFKKDRQIGLWKAYDEEGNTIDRKRY